MKDFYYIEPKKDDKFALVGSSDWTQVYSVIEFAELGFCSDDNFYHLFAYATRFTNINKFGDKNWEFEPQLIKMKVAKKDYQKEDKDKNKVNVAQSRLEKWICWMLDARDPSVIYSGFIKLQDDPMCEMFLTGIGLAGEQIDETVLNQMLKMSAIFDPVAEPQYIKPEDVQPPKGFSNKGGYSGKPAQTELERLRDRLAFVCEQINKMDDSIPVENLAQLADVLSIAENKEEVQVVFDLCTSLMS
ncbi:MAG: hypothetical protein RM368_27965 [Nostoc sp. DedSLP03]|uniref:hypothetical protein n=1 Tax=Nostoc sp. DedSLP03 TaxID=3075400 RepID=UPI002AD42213|nr:hypothetical protein [Nostoc sp. DedSLP03]MDZ7968744.1 hypothetical protein [Nostoc sp. DedSLP03]